MKTKYTKVNFNDIFVTFGGFLSFTIRFLGYCMQSFQRASIQNSMIKSMYSTERNQDSDDDGDDKHQRTTSSSKSKAKSTFTNVSESQRSRMILTTGSGVLNVVGSQKDSSRTSV